MDTDNLSPRDRQWRNWREFTQTLHLLNPISVAIKRELSNPLLYLYDTGSQLNHSLRKIADIGYYNGSLPDDVKLRRDYWTWVGNSKHTFLPETQHLLALNEAERDAERRMRRIFTQQLFRNPDFQRIPLHEVEVFMKEPYPPEGYWLYESEEVYDFWWKRIQEDPQPDSRLPRHDMLPINFDYILVDLSSEDSAIFRCKKTGALQCIVIRDFCPDEIVLEWVDSVVLKNVETQRSIRLEDAGSIVQSGWSAGARSCLKFDWVRNFLHATSDTEARSMRYEACSVFALLWNMCKAKLPIEVIDDFETFLDQEQIYRMDHGWTSGNPDKTYTVKFAGHTATFSNADMAPPAGIFATNYARHTHHEQQPHKWSISWTTGRTGGKYDGGHFYLSPLKLRIQGASNTLVLWNPTYTHGTSLQRISPDVLTTFQSGLGFVTGMRLVTAFKRYKAREITLKEAQREAVSIEHEYGEDTSN